MSRIGKKPITLPAGVTASVDGHTVAIKGPKGELSQTFDPSMTITLNDGVLTVTRPSDVARHRALHGLTRALLNNMVEGVSKGFEIILDIEGVGYKADLAGKTLVLSLGYSHDIRVEPGPSMSFEIPADSRGRTIIIRGIDKQQVGEMAAFIRRQRPPEPYQGKGIRYRGERIIRKAGKTGKA